MVAFGIPAVWGAHACPLYPHAYPPCAHHHGCAHTPATNIPTNNSLDTHNSAHTLLSSTHHPVSPPHTHTGGKGVLAEEEAQLLKLREEKEAVVRQELARARAELEAQGAETGAGKLCATPFGIDVVGITEAIALTGALVGGRMLGMIFTAVVFCVCLISFLPLLPLSLPPPPPTASLSTIPLMPPPSPPRVCCSTAQGGTGTPKRTAAQNQPPTQTASPCRHPLRTRPHLRAPRGCRQPSSRS